MPEIIHFRESDKIIKKKGLEPDVNITLEYVEAMLYGIPAGDPGSMPS
jgi:hypothetical protein